VGIQVQVPLGKGDGDARLLEFAIDRLEREQDTARDVDGSGQRGDGVRAARGDLEALRQDHVEQRWLR
jgi:hypothetical protein